MRCHVSDYAWPGMGCWLSCARPHRDVENEQQPLLDAGAVHDAEESTQTIHQEELGRIIATTHDHFIDITTMAQPDHERPEEPIDVLQDSLANIPENEWAPPPLRQLTEDEERLLDEAIPEIRDVLRVPKIRTPLLTYSFSDSK